MAPDIVASYLVGGLTTLAGLSIARGEVRNLRDGLASRQWPHTRGQILARAMHLGTGARNDSALALEYEYHVGGTRMIGGRVDYGGRGSGRHLADALLKYRVGRKVTVYYDPVDPSVAVLEPGVTLGTYLRLAVGFAVIVGGSWVLAFGLPVGF